MEKYHTPLKELVCSGCKQKCVIRAAPDSDFLSGRVWATLLRRSAMAFRTNANPPLDSKCNDVNAEIRLVPKETKPVLVKRANVLTSGSSKVRRVGNIHHTRYLANLLTGTRCSCHRRRTSPTSSFCTSHIYRSCTHHFHDSRGVHRREGLRRPGLQDHAHRQEHCDRSGRHHDHRPQRESSGRHHEQQHQRDPGGRHHDNEQQSSSSTTITRRCGSQVFLEQWASSVTPWRDVPSIGSARLRRLRRPPSWWRHEQQSIAVGLADATHHRAPWYMCCLWSVNSIATFPASPCGDLVGGAHGLGRLFGKDVHEEGVEFGERVLWRKHRSNDMNVVLDARWAEGVWLGHLWGTTIILLLWMTRFLKCVLSNVDQLSNDGVGRLWNAFDRFRGKNPLAPPVNEVPLVVLPLLPAVEPGSRIPVQPEVAPRRVSIHHTQISRRSKMHADGWRSWSCFCSTHRCLSWPSWANHRWLWRPASRNRRGAHHRIHRGTDCWQWFPHVYCSQHWNRAKLWRSPVVSRLLITRVWRANITETSRILHRHRQSAFAPPSDSEARPNFDAVLDDRVRIDRLLLPWPDQWANGCGKRNLRPAFDPRCWYECRANNRWRNAVSSYLWYDTCASCPRGCPGLQTSREKPYIVMGACLDHWQTRRDKRCEVEVYETQLAQGRWTSWQWSLLVIAEKHCVSTRVAAWSLANVEHNGRRCAAQTGRPNISAQCQGWVYWVVPWLPNPPPASSEIRCEALQHAVAEREFRCHQLRLRRVRVGCTPKRSAACYGGNQGPWRSGAFGRLEPAKLLRRHHPGGVAGGIDQSCSTGGTRFMQDGHVWDVVLVAESWSVAGKVSRASGSTSRRATSRSLWFAAGVLRKNLRTPNQMISSHPRRRWKHSSCCPMRLVERRHAQEVAKSW